jgi:muramoyltetrapeptide carboxypeptidase
MKEMKNQLIWMFTAILLCGTMTSCKDIDGEEGPITPGDNSIRLRCVAPDYLKAGDKVALISPSYYAPMESVTKTGELLRSWGLVPLIGPNVGKVEAGKYAGTVEDRVSDIRWALNDPDIKAIVCTRGGYGSAMLLDPMTREDFRRNPKWIVGYSDITALHSAMVCSGVMSLHANMGGALGERGADDPINLMLRDVLMGNLPSYTVPAHPLNKVGTARGIVIGGNMAVFTNIGGSREWDFLDRENVRGRDIILFFEDVSESMARVNSMLQQLRLKGVLSHVKGIIVGRFTEYEPSNGYTDMNEMLAETLNGYDIPVCYDFPASHDENWNYPLIEGCPARLEVTPDGVKLTFEKQ